MLFHFGGLLHYVRNDYSEGGGALKVDEFAMTTPKEDCYNVCNSTIFLLIVSSYPLLSRWTAVSISLRSRWAFLFFLCVIGCYQTLCVLRGLFSFSSLCERLFPFLCVLGGLSLFLCVIGYYQTLCVLRGLFSFSSVWTAVSISLRYRWAFLFISALSVGFSLYPLCDRLLWDSLVLSGAGC